MVVYYVDSEGNCVPGDLFCVGSGGSLAYAVLDSAFNSIQSMQTKSSLSSLSSSSFPSDDNTGSIDVNHDNLNIKASLTHSDTTTTSTSVSTDSIDTSRKMSHLTAIDIAVRAIRHASHRDSYSGGYINVFYINSKGAYHIYREDSRNIPISVNIKEIIQK